jgi:hypothetical protein
MISIRFLAYETLTLGQAKAHVKKPRAGGAAKPLYLDADKQPPKKKARTEDSQQGSSQRESTPSTSGDYVPVIIKCRN